MWMIPCVLTAMTSFSAPLAIVEPDPLAGPKVAERSAPIVIAMSGEMVRESIRAEEAVVRKLTLAPATRERVERVLNQRGRAMVRFILGHIELLNKLVVTQSTGESAATGVLLWDALGRLEQSGFRGDLAGSLRDAMSAEEAAAFDRALGAHWAEFAASKLGKPVAKITRGEVYAARLEETLGTFAKELEAAFQRAERSGEFVVAYLLDGLQLSPTQKDRIDGIVYSKLDSIGEEAPEAEKIAVLVGILAYLTPDQQERLMKKINGR